MFLREFRGVVFRRRIIHDVWEAPLDGLGGRFDREIIRPLLRLHNGASPFAKRFGIGQRPGGTSREAENSIQGIFIIAEHEKHLHVIHDCAYSGSTCRCLHIQRLRDYTTTDELPEEDTRWRNTQERYVDEGEITLKEQENSAIRIGKRRQNVSPGTTIQEQESSRRNVRPRTTSTK